MFKNLKTRKEVNTQKMNTLDAIVAAIGDATNTRDKMNGLINSIESLLFEIQKRSGVLCSKNLRFNDYACNPPKDLLTNSGEALVALGRFRSNLKDSSIIDKLENALLEVQSSAGFAASIKNTQVNVIGVAIIMDSACALALLGRLRLEQSNLVEGCKCGCEGNCGGECDGCGCDVEVPSNPVEPTPTDVDHHNHHDDEVVIQIEDDEDEEEEVLVLEAPVEAPEHIPEGGSFINSTSLN